MSINATSPALQMPQPAEQKETGQNTLGQDEFMKLLVTQLSQQDPLSPVDNGEFIAQLAQFSGLEAMVAVRDSVDTLTLMQSAATNAQVASLVGREITVRGDGFQLEQGEPVELGYDLSAPAESMNVTIYNDRGEKVRTITMHNPSPGVNNFKFDGRDDNNNPLPAGSYTFKAAAFDAAQNPIEVDQISGGRVTGVSFENGYAELLFEGTRVGLGDVVEIRE